MVAHGALVGGLGADDDVAAVRALPDGVAVAREDKTVLDVLQEFAIAGLMLAFDGSDLTELLGNLVESFGFSLGSHAVVHISPFVVLALSSVLQVGLSVSHLAAVEVLVPDLGMFFLIGRRFFEDLGDLNVAVLFGFGGKEGVLVAGHGFAGKCFEEVFLRFGSFEVHKYNGYGLQNMSHRKHRNHRKWGITDDTLIYIIYRRSELLTVVFL